MTTSTLVQFDTLSRALRVQADLHATDAPSQWGGDADVINGQRRGQYVFNTMAEAFPQIAEPIAGSIVDCFHQSFKIDAFLDACETRALETLS